MKPRELRSLNINFRPILRVYCLRIKELNSLQILTAIADVSSFHPVFNEKVLVISKKYFELPNFAVHLLPCLGAYQGIFVESNQTSSNYMQKVASHMPECSFAEMAETWKKYYETHLTLDRLDISCHSTIFGFSLRPNIDYLDFVTIIV